MRIVRSLEPALFDRNSIVTVGTFDGVHRAHRQIIERIVERARARSGRSVVVTFDPHPKEVVRSAQGPVELLTTLEERCERMGELGVDLTVVLPFTQATAHIDAPGRVRCGGFGTGAGSFAWQQALLDFFQ